MRLDLLSTIFTLFEVFIHVYMFFFVIECH